MTPSITPIIGFAHLTDLPCWELTYGNASVVVSAYGAHVLHYGLKPSAQQKAEPSSTQLWLSPTAVWQGQQPIRGGVPICWPWFGKIDPTLVAKIDPQRVDGLKLPNHGLVRTRLWQQTDAVIEADNVRIELSLKVDDIPWHPEPVTLRYQVRLAEQLTLTLSCDAPIAQQAALHSYFAVSDSRTVQVKPLPAAYYDKVTDAQCLSQSEVLQFVGETDRVYPKTADTLTLTDHATQLHISQQGHDASVLWNPAAEKAAASSDIPATQWAEFVCIESARLTLDAAPLSLVQIIRPQ